MELLTRDINLNSLKLVRMPSSINIMKSSIRKPLIITYLKEKVLILSSNMIFHSLTLILDLQTIFQLYCIRTYKPHGREITQRTKVRI